MSEVTSGHIANGREDEHTTRGRQTSEEQQQTSSPSSPVATTDATKRTELGSYFADQAESSSPRSSSRSEVANVAFKEAAAKSQGKQSIAASSSLHSRLTPPSSSLSSSSTAVSARKMDEATASATERLLGKRPASNSPPSLNTAAGASTPASSNAASSSRTARQTRRIARQLLTMVTCASCDQPYTNPVTLPCGHSTCMPCISKRIQAVGSANAIAAAASSSKHSHVPPRLPLCSMTVPCSVGGCPRSAIGQGLGVWAGYSAAFGPPSESSLWLDEEGHDEYGVPYAASSTSHADNTNEPGVLPVDGFVVGAENQSLRLGVIPPQPRDKANIFAMSPFLSEDGGDVKGLSLRTDVTLAKAVAVLKRYAEPPADASGSRSSSTGSGGNGQRSRRALRGFASARRHGQQYNISGGASSSVNSISSRRQGTTRNSRRRQGPSSLLARGSAHTEEYSPRLGATRIAPMFRTMLGGSEADVESGSVGGIRATDTDEDDDYEDARFNRSRPYNRRMSRHAPLRDSSSSQMSWEATPSPRETPEPSAGDEREYEAPNGQQGEETSTAADSSGSPSRPAATGQALTATPSESPSSDKDDAKERSATEANATMPSGLPAAAASGSGEQQCTKLITPEHLLSDLTDTLECQLCYLLQYEPITTPCGHTFCRSCFARSLDHSSKCPLCRTTMPSFAFFQDHPPNQALLRLLKSQLGASERDERLQSARKDRLSPSTYPQEELLSLSRLGVFTDSHAHGGGQHVDAWGPSKAARRSRTRGQEDDDDEEEDDMAFLTFGLRRLYEERAATVEEEERHAASWMPIFVCALAFPTMPTNLHIFEPRYRLMVRRCLQGQGPARFGMVLPSRNLDSPVPGLSEYGTMLDIKNAQMLLDGRSMLETVGGRRFKLLETGSLDGYTTGKIQYFDDITSQEVDAEEYRVREANDGIIRQRAEAEQARTNEAAAALASLGEEASPTPAPDQGQSETSRSVSPSVVLPPLTSIPAAGSPPPPSTPQDLQPTIADLLHTCVSFIELLRTRTAPGLFDQIVATYGPVPQVLELDKLSWWLGMVLPIDEHAKSSLLPLRSPRKRLEVIAGWIERIEESWRPRG